MARKPPIRRARGTVGDIKRAVPRSTLVQSATLVGITTAGALETYIRELDALWGFARAAEQDNSETNCSKEVHSVAHAAKVFLEALEKAGLKSRASIDWAMRRTELGINDLIATAQTAVLYIEPIDYKARGVAVPEWSMAPVHADIGAKLIRLYEQHLPEQEFTLGEKLTGQAGFQYGTPAAGWFALTMQIIFPDIIISRLTSAAEAAREIAGKARRTG